MAQILSAMISVLLAWSALALIFVGLGLLIRRSFALIVRDAQSLLTSLWIGWRLQFVSYSCGILYSK
jgi:hypothetical protein